MSLFPELDGPPSDRLFFGLYPPADVAEGIASRARQLIARRSLSGAALAAERLHVTLHHIGDYVGFPRGIADRAMEAGAAVAAKAAPFAMTFDRAGSFSNRGNNPFVLQGGEGLAALCAFQLALGVAMARAGLAAQVARQFTPHVTVLYDPMLLPDTPARPVSWRADELVLVHSLLGQTRHMVLGRWPLRGKFSGPADDLGGSCSA